METREQTRKKRKRYRRQKHQGDWWRNNYGTGTKQWYLKRQEEQKRLDERKKATVRWKKAVYGVLYFLLACAMLAMVAAAWLVLTGGPR